MKLHINSETKPDKMLILHRYFYPVGQGAFYSEVFNDDAGFQCAVVYDCGTETAEKDFLAVGGKKLNDQISDFATSFSSRKRFLDFLFISHLHADHVNGISDLIRQLPPKKIVLPMLPQNMILVSRIANLVRYGDSAIEADELIQSLYYAERSDVIGVSPAEQDEEKIESKVLYPLTPSSILDSGSALNVGVDSFWRYRPFNSIALKDPRVPVLLNEVRKIPGVLIDDALDLRNALDHLEELKGAYKTAMRNANDNLYTLVVESEPLSGIADKDKLYDSHCVYFGDFEPHDDTWNRFLAVINDYDQVGTIQVPHHGSKSNWRKDILSANAKLAIISSGSSNRYHHPNYWVTEEIRLRNVKFNVTSERPESAISQCIRVR